MDGFLLLPGARWPSGLERWLSQVTGRYGTRNFFPINAPGMGRFQLLNLGVLTCYGIELELRFWVAGSDSHLAILPASTARARAVTVATRAR